MEITNSTIPTEYSSQRFKVAEEGRNELGQEDFLRLMITQIQNQDPFQPLQSGEFIAQLAQFGTVSGIGDLNESFGDLAASLATNQSYSVAGLIGKNALVSGDKFSLSQGEPADLYVDANGYTGASTITITNGSGQVVRELSVNLTDAGLNRITWDGKGNGGAELESGDYQLTAYSNLLDSEIPLSTFVKQGISSVDVDSSNRNEVVLGLQSGELVELSSVKRILE